MKRGPFLKRRVARSDAWIFSENRFFRKLDLIRSKSIRVLPQRRSSLTFVQTLRNFLANIDVNAHRGGVIMQVHGS